LGSTSGKDTGKHMLSLRSFAIFAASLMSFGMSIAFGQNYPNRPIRIASAAAGTSADVATRIIAQGISGPLGQQVVVDNRATAVIAADAIAKAPPDGYSLLLAGTSLWVTPLMEKATYDPVKDFVPITLSTVTPYVVLVHPSLSVRSIQELVALAKTKPGEINYASAGSGSPSHLATELLKSMAGINIVRINYKSTAAASTDLIAGNVQLTIAPFGPLVPYVKSGKLRALAVTSEKPSTLFPGLPTVSDSGLPGYVAVQYQGVFAPAKTPAAINMRLAQEIVRVLNQPEVREKFFGLGAEVVGSSPDQFAAVIKSDMEQLGGLIKTVGIKTE